MTAIALPEELRGSDFDGVTLCQCKMVGGAECAFQEVGRAQTGNAAAPFPTRGFRGRITAPITRYPRTLTLHDHAYRAEPLNLRDIIDQGHERTEGKLHRKLNICARYGRSRSAVPLGACNGS